MGVIGNRRLATALLAATAALALTTPTASAASAGKVNFDLNSTSRFDSLLTDSTRAERTWMHDTYHRVRGYSPWFDVALPWDAPADFYKDLYAIYRDGPDDQALLAAHPDWVLRDAQGHELYIPCDCANGSCTQYAADIGNPDFRAYWIQQAELTMAKGYHGIFVDDVNMTMTVSDGNGTAVRPIDPRTGNPMSDAAWSRYVADFTDQIRAAFPGKEIVHNVPWFNSQSDPQVQREVSSADVLELERGFNDPGITGGNGTFGYNTFLRHIDWLHSRGVNFVLEPYLSSSTEAKYELANYLLTSNGHDSITSGWHATPSDFWSGWQTDLGAARGPRYFWNGLERRDFAGGTVLVNPPDSPDRVVHMNRHRHLSKRRGGRIVTRVALSASRGIVLRRDG